VSVVRRMFYGVIKKITSVIQFKITLRVEIRVKVVEQVFSFCSVPPCNPIGNFVVIQEVQFVRRMFYGVSKKDTKVIQVINIHINETAKSFTVHVLILDLD
jgi:hypothetical protein